MWMDRTTRYADPGYVGFGDLPHQVRRKFVKRGFDFTIMVVGETGLGKSTLVNTLFLTNLYSKRIIPEAIEKTDQIVRVDVSTAEIEEKGMKLRLTVVDTPGYGDAIDNSDSFRANVEYIDDQFERFLSNERGINRRNIVDNRVHCCLFFISPLGHGLKPLDIEFMKQLHEKVNLVPVIAKADALTKLETLRLKKRVLDELKENGIKIYPLTNCDSDEEENRGPREKELREAIPFAVCASNMLIGINGQRTVRGRLYQWGVVEVDQPDHCDFVKLRTMLINHMHNMQEVTHEVHYENYRSERLANEVPPTPPPETAGEDDKSNVSEGLAEEAPTPPPPQTAAEDDKNNNVSERVDEEDPVPLPPQTVVEDDKDNVSEKESN